MKERTKDLTIVGLLIGLIILSTFIQNSIMSSRIDKLNAIRQSQLAEIRKDIKVGFKLLNKRQDKNIADVKEEIQLRNSMVIEYKEYIDKLYISNFLNKEVVEK